MMDPQGGTTGLDVDGHGQPKETPLFDAVLTKPVPFADLATTVRQTLDRKI